MPSKSKKQQKFMGMVRAAQKGENPASAAVAKVADKIDQPVDQPVGARRGSPKGPPKGLRK